MGGGKGHWLNLGRNNKPWIRWTSLGWSMGVVLAGLPVERDSLRSVWEKRQ